MKYYKQLLFVDSVQRESEIKSTFKISKNSIIYYSRTIPLIASRQNFGKRTIIGHLFNFSHIHSLRYICL